MKKIISWVLVTLLIFAMPITAIAESTESTESAESAESTPVIWDGTLADEMSVGNGTEEDPYVISTPQELAFLSYGTALGIPTEGYYFELGADIYLNDTSVENWQETANEWIPIGYMANAFCGNFDGKGHKIVGLYISAESNIENAGLFGTTEGAASIKNIELVDADVSGMFAGGIVGFQLNGMVSGCKVDGKITGLDYAGGIVGANCANIAGCINEADVVCEDGIAGGIAGAIDASEADAAISQCINKGSVSGFNIGGIIGGISNGDSNNSVVECLNVGELTGTIVGGIVGSNYIYTDVTTVATISDSMNIGTINVLLDGIGAGIVCDYQDGVIVKNCWNKGVAVLDRGAAFAGVAYRTDDSGILSVGETDTTASLEPIFKNCYYLDTTAENGSLGFDVEPEGIIAVSESDMSEQATFERFDFENIWGIADGEPVLQFAHEHTFDMYAHNKEYHYPLCECGVTMEGEAHELGDWEIIFDATCEDEGMTGRKCSICNIYIETAVIEAYGCMRGDINNDGKIDADDYILLKRIHFGMAKMENLDLPQTAIYRCDVNIDSLVNADDYIMLKRAYFGTYVIG